MAAKPEDIEKLVAGVRKVFENLAQPEKEKRWITFLVRDADPALGHETKHHAQVRNMPPVVDLHIKKKD